VPLQEGGVGQDDVGPAGHLAGHRVAHHQQVEVLDALIVSCSFGSACIRLVE